MADYLQKEYQELCARGVRLLMSSAPSGPVEDHHIDEHHYPNLPSTDAHIGRYYNASHYKDGLFSEVFRASSQGSEHQVDQAAAIVALKVTTPAMMVAPHNSARESRILKSIAGSNVISLIETFEQPGGRLVLVFPFLPLDLNTMLHQRQITTHTQRKSILRDIFTAIAHIHKQGIIHRDVKPSNILLASPTGPAYLSDFGIAWSPTDAASEPPGQKHLEVGTTCYRPPELLFGRQNYGTRLDMWAAGCVAAQVVCLNGASLFDAGDLGSELALIRSIFETLGTPNHETWPEAKTLPDWGKMQFTVYPGRHWEDILAEGSPGATHLVSRLVVFESGNRLTAEESLEHPYLVE